MDDSTYKEQLKTQKDKSQAIKHRESDRLALSQNNSSLGLGLGGGLGGLGALFGAQNQQLQILTMLNSKGGEAINSSVFVSNVWFSKFDSYLVKNFKFISSYFTWVFVFY